MANKGAVYTRKVIAQLLDLSEKRVRQLTQEGIIEEYSSGYYRLVPTVQGYLKYLRSQIGDSGEASDYNTEKARLTKVKREDAELEFKLKKNELHRAADIEFIITNMLVAFKARLLTVPYKVLPALLNIEDNSDRKDKIAEVLKEAIDECLTELSDYDPEMFSDGKYLENLQEEA